ncbi:hypothetical protein [Parasitella parasitica]|uniref:Uncharacterized protein n=1 Tax=Parasitella parasitica TaxID=35722 RepID=A0A0B7N5L7_9FUNG|nr:hypothetical protein [Parasitella parasitica]
MHCIFPKISSHRLECIYLVVSSQYKEGMRVSQPAEMRNPAGVRVTLATPLNEWSEAKYSVNEIQRISNNSKGLIALQDCAILIRKRSLSHYFESALKKRFIPFDIVDLPESQYLYLEID